MTHGLVITDDRPAAGLTSMPAIDNPSGGPASTEDHGELEFLLAFVRA